MKKNIRIIVITRPNCNACSSLCYELRKRIIPYEPMTPIRAEKLLKGTSFSGVPITLVIDHNVQPYQVSRFNGYGKLTLKKILERIGYEEPPYQGGGNNA